MPGGDRRQADQALAANLAAGMTVENAANEVGISPRTAFRRLREEPFQQLIREIRGNAYDQAVNHLVSRLTEASAVLAQLLHAESESVRLSAATRLLELGIRFHEQYDLSERIARLEEQLESQ